MVAWTAHTLPSADTIYAVSALTVSAANWDAVFPKAAPQVQPRVSAASEAGLTVTTQLANIESKTGAYVAVIEAGTASELSQTNMGLAMEYVRPTSFTVGAATSTVEVPAAKLDRSKQYEVVAWTAHTLPSADTIYAVSALTVSAANWDAVFPKQVSGSAAVSAASESGLTVRAEVSGVDPASQPAGVHVGVVLRGTAVGAAQSSFLGATQSIATIPESGSFESSVVIPADKLDRSKEYEVVVWPRRTNPSEANIVKVLPFEVSAANWDAVFPKAAPQVQPRVSAASEAGLTVTTQLANIESKTGAYVAVIEAGTASELSQTNMGLAMEYVRPTSFTVGAATSTVEVPAAKLDRSKQYEVVAWTAHTLPSADTIYAVTPLAVSAEQWNAVFPSAGARVIPGISHVGTDGVSVTAVISDLALEADDAGIYVSLIERGTEADISEGNMGTAYAFVRRNAIVNGATTLALSAPAANLDRNTEYEVIVWRAHGYPSEDRMLTRADVTITPEQWDEVFGSDFVVSGTAAVSATSAAKLQVAAKLRGVDPTRYPNGVSVALIAAGTSAKPQPIGTTQVASIPASGAFTAEITAAGSALDRTRSYEVLVWAGKTPGGAANLLTLPVSISKANWDAVFPPKVDTLPGSFEWGVRGKFREYVTGPIATGKITVTAPATGSSVYKFPQVSGGTWDAKKQTGTVKFAGNVNFSGHAGALDLNLTNPVLNVTSTSRAELRAEYQGKLLTIATLDLSAGTKRAAGAEGVRFTGVPVTLTEAGAREFFQEYLNVDDVLDHASFTIGAATSVKPVTPPKPKPVTPTKPKPVDPVQPVAPTDGAQQAGSLTWGISSGYAAYTTGRIAKGNITSSGVGGGAGGYVFPQASSSWDAHSQTGTVQYSGVVTFTGHKGLMSESFANPVISITGPTSGTLTAGGRSFGLDLGAGSKSVGANGEVTWSGVPLSGGISGGGGGGGGAFGADPVSFTIGAVSGASFGSTAVGPQNTKRTAADLPPVTSGIRILTDPKKLVPGGEIEFEASGFEAGERDVLVVLYSDPIVLDDAAGADANGVVRWIGTLPKDLTPGEHTITLQGSTNAGAVFTVSAAKKAKAKTAEQETGEEIVAEANAQTPVAAGVAPSEDTPIWLWWAGAIALLAVAGAMGGLVVAQRRKAAVAVGISGGE